VILPHVIGPQAAVAGNNVSWAELVAESALVLAFGGMALKNNGCRRRRQPASTSPRIASSRPAGRGVEFHLIGPLRDDLPAAVEAVWHPIRPGTDVGLMLGLAHTLVAEGLHDRAVLGAVCTGWEIFRGVSPRPCRQSAERRRWAADICGIRRAISSGLARRCVGHGAPSHLLAIPAARRAWRAARLDGRVLAACSARSDCRAAVSPMRSARPRTPASRPWRCHCRPCRPAATISPISSRSRASRHAAAARREVRL